MLDVIQGGEVDLVVNTQSFIGEQEVPGGPVMRDGFSIRRAAVERRIPCLTSLDTAAALVESAAVAAADFEVRTIPEWRGA